MYFAAGRGNGSTGGVPAQRARGTPCCTGGSGRSVAPGASGCVPKTDPESGRSGSMILTRTYKPAGKQSQSPSD